MELKYISKNHILHDENSWLEPGTQSIQIPNPELPVLVKVDGGDVSKAVNGAAKILQPGKANVT